MPTLDCSPRPLPTPGTSPLDLVDLLPVGTALEFCTSGTGGPSDAAGDVLAEVPGIGAAISGARIYQADLLAEVPGIGASISGSYQRRPLPRSYALRWDRSRHSGACVAHYVRRPIPADRSDASPWRRANASGRCELAAWARATPHQACHRAAWHPASGAGRATRPAWGTATPADQRGALRWELAGAMQACLRYLFSAATIIDPAPISAGWQRGLPGGRCLLLLFERGQRRDQCRIIPFAPSATRDRQDRVPPVVWPVEPDPVYEVPDRGIYIVPIAISVVTLPGRDPVECESLSISTDIDSWAWTLNASIIDRASFDLVSPVAGVAAHIEVNLNGYLWEFIVDDPAQTAEFNADIYTLTASSVTAVLAAPYERPRDLTSSALATAQQLALAELPLSGWTLGWEPPDWAVPAGAWSYQGLTPIQAISRLAAGIGAAVQSEPTGQGLRVIPRYPVMPWGLDAAVPDYGLDIGACLHVRRRVIADGAPPNAVYVHGDSLGILGHAVRASTAGDIELATTVEPLITAVEAARGLAGRLLADAYTPPRMASFAIPLSSAAGDYPLVAIGDIISVLDGLQDDRGICAALQIHVTPPGLAFTDGPDITQTISLHGQRSAISRLSAILPRPPLLVGTVQSTALDTATVQLIGGGQVVVRGQANVSDSVYIRNGVIEGIAPALATVPIAV